MTKARIARASAIVASESDPFTVATTASAPTAQRPTAPEPIATDFQLNVNGVSSTRSTFIGYTLTMLFRPSTCSEHERPTHFDPTTALPDRPCSYGTEDKDASVPRRAPVPDRRSEVTPFSGRRSSCLPPGAPMRAIRKWPLCIGVFVIPTLPAASPSPKPVRHRATAHRARPQPKDGT